ncbi:hypothetical protein DPMN_103772 [Dreissena polymorpha]|uniref:Uncharacterized protein n=1 Tax=Dreissena polymorpha TaxID=45954 RepID=A0A9D4H8H7_DREPO|nr:hypothetical protein DPMN_103772 [Dreissena polymorpha]
MEPGCCEVHKHSVPLGDVNRREAVNPLMPLDAKVVAIPFLPGIQITCAFNR